MSNKWRVQELGSGILLLIGGLILLFRPEMTLITISNVIGLLIIIVGVIFVGSYFLKSQVATGNYDLVRGLIITAIGIFIRVRSAFVVSILPTVLGIIIVISGLVKLQHGLNLRKIGTQTWLRIGITGLINMLIGLIIILNPFSTIAWLLRLVGVGLVFSGVTDLISTVYTQKKMSDYYVDGHAEE